jgi:hypothetical protein
MRSLEPFGVSAETEARFDLMASMTAPEVEEFNRPEPAAPLHLSLGEVMRLRAGIRGVLNSVVVTINEALMVSAMTGTPIEELVAQTGVSVEEWLIQICDLEDKLAEAWAGAAAESVDFTVPDYAPDPSL